jgi:hypothetical protein
MGQIIHGRAFSKASKYTKCMPYIKQKRKRVFPTDRTLRADAPRPQHEEQGKNEKLASAIAGETNPTLQASTQRIYQPNSTHQTRRRLWT